ncbi:hypothetical protein HRG_002129 [Hirsutella rhossiliensis]|uniref:Uncharacterized protein n=1 Tax=Hirsutella rhossiliensis TaxID=111463 RepID=A0A9P8N4E5_9HYPO|nr:uncharacterized protein HRG_02129 [Hirsutella rhossiliensis]KAH0966720.1 hypothetical protein HRG_02129 [Hirsutella rhossiliensis]
MDARAAPRQPDFETISGSFDALSEQFALCGNLPAVDGGARLQETLQAVLQQLATLNRKVDGLDRKVDDLDRKLDRKITVLDKNFTARMQNSIVVHESVGLTPLYSVLTGEVIQDCPSTLQELDALTGGGTGPFPAQGFSLAAARTESREEPDKCQTTEAIVDSYASDASEQGEEDGVSRHSSQVAESPVEPVRPASPGSITSDSDHEVSADGLDLEELAASMREAVLEVVDKRVVAIVEGALQPLQKRLSDLHVAVKEYGDRVNSLATRSNEGGGEARKLSRDIQSLSRQTESVGPSVVKMQEDLHSILAKVRTLENHHAETSSLLKKVTREKSSRSADVELPATVAVAVVADIAVERAPVTAGKMRLDRSRGGREKKSGIASVTSGQKEERLRPATNTARSVLPYDCSERPLSIRVPKCQVDVQKAPPMSHFPSAPLVTGLCMYAV